MTFEEIKNNISNCRDCKKKFGFEPIPIIQGNENSKIFNHANIPKNKFPC